MCSPTALGPYCLFGVIVIDSCLVGGNKCSEISSHKIQRCLGERRRASVHVTSENYFWRATRARPHTLTVVLLLARACTWLHNHMPYFLCNLKSPFSLLISHSLYECAHAIHHKHTHSHTHRASRETCSACESCLETKKDGFHLLQLDMCHGNHILTTSQLDETCTGPWPNGRGDLKTKEGLPPWHPAISSCSPSCLFNMTCILQIFL